MKLKDLKAIIEHTEKSCRDWEDLDVVIPNNSYSMGPIGVTGIRGANKGFDWESDMFILWPDVNMQNIPEETPKVRVCVACNFEKNGVKTRKNIPHTCGK